MPKHNEIGIKGEQLACDFLIKKGYFILHRNWRTGRKEVDIVAVDREMVVFVEIKTRTGTQFGFPEDAVDKRKQTHLKVAADIFLEQNPAYKTLRFDVVSIMIEGGYAREIVHFEEAFY